MRRVTNRGWVIAALAWLLGGCAGLQEQFKQPELSLSDARITGMSLADAQLAFDVDVKNPNPIGVSMKGLSYTLQLQEKPLFDGALSERLQIGANGSSRLTLPFSLRYEDIFGTLLALRDNKELRYKISGEADFGLIRIPYSRTGTFAVPQLPEISVESLRVNKLGLDGVDLALALKVGNANTFPIRLDGIDYNLKLANSSLIKGGSATPLSVDANKSGRMVLKLNLNYAQIGTLLQTLRSAGSLPIEFDSQMKLPGVKGTTLLPYGWKGEVPLYR
ncbi:MAG TPA: LEA type 2 family protein [Gammaproteobacteria bacterium]